MMQTNIVKLEQVLHYIINEVGAMPNVGKTVLYKHLYFCDFNYYEIYEEPLTGEEYVKLPLGPAPKNFDKIITKLIQDNKIEKIDNDYFGHLQEKYLSLVEPDVSCLEGKELKVIEDTIKELRYLNASQISAFSHADIPWKATEEMEIIDYDLVFYRDDLTSVREDKNEACD